MRGSPIIRALLAFLVIAALGWPLWRLTRAELIGAPTATAATVTAKAIDLHLTFTTTPKSLVVRHLGQEVWKETAPAAELEHALSLPYPAEGVDLQFHVEWPDDAPLAALRVRLTDPAGETYEKTVWGKGTVDEVLTFP